jgi:hypothetical protein
MCGNRNITAIIVTASDARCTCQSSSAVRLPLLDGEADDMTNEASLGRSDRMYQGI